MWKRLICRLSKYPLAANPYLPFYSPVLTPLRLSHLTYIYFLFLFLSYLLRCYTEWVNTDYSTQWCYENYVQVRQLNKARDIREQLQGLCERVEVEVSVNETQDNEAICKALTAGYFYNTSKLSKSGDFKTVKQQHTVYIHPSSVMSKGAFITY